MTERQPRHWFWGVLGWAGITLLCLATHLGGLERDLMNRSTDALGAAGISEITAQDIDFTGEIATLRGTVSDEAVSDDAIDILLGVPGVRRVVNETIVAPVPEPATAAVSTPPTVEATLSGTIEDETLTLTGTVPSREVADLWLAAAAATYGNVVDHLTVGANVSSPDWLGAFEALSALDTLPEGSFTISDGLAVLEGVVADQATKDAVEEIFAAAVPGLEFDGRLQITASEGDDPAASATAEISEIDLAGITFETGSAVITDQGMAVLDEAVSVLRSFPTVDVAIEGHTDSAGEAITNEELSLSRARAVMVYLVDHGIDPGRLSPVGYGETRPIADNSTAEGRAQNRRIEFVITESE